MKMIFKSFGIVLITLLIGEMILLTGCKKDPVLPALTTTPVKNVTINTAVSGGSITSNGGAEITARGVCFGTASQPEIAGPHTSDNKGDGVFESNLTGLTPGTKYFVRAYATNSAGTNYGNEITFETVPLALPSLTTVKASGVTSNFAVSGGNISNDGGDPILAKGVCWATTENPTIINNPNKTLNGVGKESFASDISSLNYATTYHVRAYATNSVGTAYGNDETFTTLPVRPTLTTAAITERTWTSAKSGGTISSDGGSTITDKGICWSKSSVPVATGSYISAGTGNAPFSITITNLDPATTYYVRAYAINSEGTAYGNEQSFTTNTVTEPSVTTAAVTGVSLTTAVSGGNISNNNGGTVLQSGVCWNTTGDPTVVSDSKTTDGSASGSFSSNITGLAVGTVYYVRAYATNSVGTGYGSQIRFSTSISDIEGNVYRTVLIGTQLWMQSDLKTTMFSDGAPIPNVTDDGLWSTQTAPAYSWYDNLPSYSTTYGILYNWYAVETAQLCPNLWHVPSDEEFNTMELYLGVPPDKIDDWGYRGDDEGSQMKNQTGWATGQNGTNLSGFSALPGGYRYGRTGTFNDIGNLTYWWTRTLDGVNEFGIPTAWYRLLDGTSQIYRASTSVRGGKFIRCVKNNP